LECDDVAVGCQEVLQSGVPAAFPFTDAVTVTDGREKHVATLAVTLIAISRVGA
jgi:hypothetical protein